ncbi:MAG TPA: nuclear transport factor 2 family protein [Terriglobales bacterium]|nr:nuclear transport factor 2 family protein [Terriglobales bacterium]
MTRYLVIFALTLLAAIPALAQQGRWAAPDDKTAKYMIDMERRWAEDACDHNLISETILAEDFQGTAPDGKRYTKAEETEESRHPTRQISDCRLDEAKVRFFGETVALVYGSESRTLKAADGKEHPETLIWTDTWLKRGGKWQIVAAQDMKSECK